MNHFQRGFVVSAWVELLEWVPVWTTPDGDLFVFADHDTGWAHFSCRADFRPRDPNRTDEGDRPDLLETANVA